MFQFVFNAVRVEFPPFISQHESYILQYSRFGSFYHYETKKLQNKSEAEGFGIYYENPLIFETDASMFKCLNQMYISIQFACDGLNNCLGVEDEKNCKCNQTNDCSTSCKIISSIQGRKTCSLFYMKTADGHCHLYNSINGKYHQSSTIKCNTLQTNFHSSPEYSTHKGFSCNNAVNISSLLVNDLVSDCGPEADDEPLLKSIATGNSSHCINKNQIPCR